jgi:hypothetical protein
LLFDTEVSVDTHRDKDNRVCHSSKL